MVKIYLRGVERPFKQNKTQTDNLNQFCKIKILDKKFCAFYGEFDCNYGEKLGTDKNKIKSIQK